MIDHGNGEIRTPHTKTFLFKESKSLGRCDFVQEMQSNVKDGRLLHTPRLDQILLPNFVKQCLAQTQCLPLVYFQM